MVSVKKNAKLLTKLLAVLLFAIWGEIAYQLFLNKSSPPGTVSGQTIFGPEIRAHARSHFIFKHNVRDPFAYVHPILHSRKRPRVIPLIVHLWSPPRVSLEGVILGNGKQTAILTTQKGQTFFLTDGDTLGGVRILKVEETEVSYRYQKKDTNWVIQNK